MLIKGKFYLWNVNAQRQEGLVRPSALHFATIDEGETVLRRYVDLFPDQLFALRLARTKTALGPMQNKAAGPLFHASEA